jgi:adenylate cyclase
MRRLLRAATLGLSTGLAGVALSMIPSIALLEDTVGLRWLFLVRGAAAPPSGVTIVSMDESSAVRLGVPQLPREWPRSLHATLVDRLVARGASTIVFDLQFFRHSPSADDDETFARALERAGRVVLVQGLDVVRTDDQEMWVRQDPVPPLAGAAVALAPAVLPDSPLISSFWSFLTTPHTGEVPSLAAVALQRQLIGDTDALIERLRRAGVRELDAASTQVPTRQPGALVEMMRTIRRAATNDRPAGLRVLAEIEAQADASLPDAPLKPLAALARLYTGPDTSYLNFYGPPGAICTVAYDRVIQDEGGALACPLQDAVVFVGLGKGPVTRSDQYDSYYAVYGGGDAGPFHGVEIHATALANLLDRSTLRRHGSSAAAATLIVVGLAMAAPGYWVRTRRRRTRGALAARAQAAGVLASIALAYTLLAFVVFTDLRIILPLVIPLIFQGPMALVLGLLVRPVQHEEQVRVVCLVTDAADSTGLGQRLTHHRYVQVMSDYNRALSEPVRLRHGEALPPQGDGFVAIWYERALDPGGGGDRSARVQACRAAIEISEAAERFNSAQPEGERLPTRIGITEGAVTIFSDADRGVFEVFGDAVNVAARLRDLNVQLGTSILALREVADGLEDVIGSRPIPGTFALKGIVTPPAICEITSRLPGGSRGAISRPPSGNAVP